MFIPGSTRDVETGWQKRGKKEKKRKIAMAEQEKKKK